MPNSTRMNPLKKSIELKSGPTLDLIDDIDTNATVIIASIKVTNVEEALGRIQFRGYFKRFKNDA